MKCERCGAIIHEGDTFCRTCATPVKKDDYISHERNQATIGFADTTKVAESVTVEHKNKFNLKNKIVEIKNKQALKAPKEVQRKDIDNHNVIDKDGNNRVKATIINIGGLVVILLIVFVLVKIFISILGNL
jgi:hypothetical protein